MYHKDPTYFRFYLLSFVLLTLSVSPVNCSGGAKSTLSSCTKVSGAAMISENATTILAIVKAEDLSECVLGAYKLYKESSWAEVEKKIPGLLKFMTKVTSKIAKNPSILGSAGKVGLQFISTYLFYKTVRLYDRAEKLQIGNEVYRKEFEYLRTLKIQPILEQIDRDIVPLLGVLNGELTLRAIDRLSYYNAELTALLQKVYKDYEEACKNKAWSAGYSLATSFLCAGSLLLSQPALAPVPCSGAVLSVSSFFSYHHTAQELRALIKDGEMLSNGIEDYLTLLKGKFHLLFSAVRVITIVIVVFWYHSGYSMTEET